METYAPYIFLGIASVFGVIQSTFQKAGVGNDEQLGEGGAAFAYVIISLPLMLLSNLGLIGIIIWSLFALKLAPALLVAAAGLLGWGYVFGLIIGSIVRTPIWGKIHQFGIPLIIAARLITSACVIYLALYFIALQSS